MRALIRLTKFVSDDKELPESLRQSYPVSILAEGENMDDHIFVYHVGKTDDPIPGDKFECVASVNQMFEIPKTQGVSLTLETGIPYYRSNVLEYVTRSETEAERIWEEIKKEVSLLVKNWNSSMRMKGTLFAEITEDIVTETGPYMTPPLRVQISYHPAGTPAIVAGKQVILVPDGTKEGWLPASYLPPGQAKPPGGAFYYNIAQDVLLQEAWPPKEPYSGNQLHRNGILLPYGICWVLVNDTIWWLDFDPATIPGYQRADPQAQDGNAPWPLDYVSQAQPGSVPNILQLTLFK